MNYKQSYRITCFLTCLLLANCASIRSGSECYVPESTLVEYDTFAWYPNPVIINDDTQTISPLMIAELKKQIKQAFESAGYNYEEDSDYTDFYISMAITTQRVVDETIYFPASQHDEANSVTTRERSHTTGFVAVDVFDGDTGEPKWRGWAERALHLDDRHDSRDAVEEVVRSIMVEFPTRELE